MKHLVWDYDLPDDWEPQTDTVYDWYLVRKLNYNDLSGITRNMLSRHAEHLDKELDPGKRIMIEYYLTGKAP